MAAATYVGHASSHVLAQTANSDTAFNAQHFAFALARDETTTGKCAAPPHHFAYAACDETHGCPGRARAPPTANTTSWSFWMIHSLVGKLSNLTSKNRRKLN
ncbi:unnamed protein product [Sphagnum jensenii]|uniref:Uncharacterized protein n=1 Tax=Sphagnum jensenii TaxID=128206 RepID=A0ABP1AR10_9BRYO